MGATTCVMNPSAKPQCRGPKGKNLDMVMYAKHLEEFYGLEMGYITHYDEVSSIVVGSFLRPVKNRVLPINTVIFPTQEFYNNSLRPQDKTSLAKGYMSLYQLNPSIVEYQRELSINKTDAKSDKRYAIETIRNLAADDIPNMGPNHIQKYMFRNFIFLVSSQKHISTTDIETQSIYNHLDNYSLCVLKDGNALELKPLLQADMSTIMKYILSKCVYSDYTINSNGEKFVDYIMYNAK